MVTSIDANAGTLASEDETQYCPSSSATSAASSAATPQPSGSAQAGATPSASGSQCSERKAGSVSASGSDLWLGEKTGGSSVTFNTAQTADRALLPRKNVDEQIVVMAMTDGKAKAPDLTISWSRQVETPWYFYGGLVLGGLFVLAGAFLFFIDLQLRRADVERRTRSAERAVRIANADSVSTEGIPQVDDPDRQLTRRELRDKERAEDSGEAWTTRARAASTSTVSRRPPSPRRPRRSPVAATARTIDSAAATSTTVEPVRATWGRRTRQLLESPVARRSSPVSMRRPLSSTGPPGPWRDSRTARRWRSPQTASRRLAPPDSLIHRDSPRLLLIPVT